MLVQDSPDALLEKYGPKCTLNEATLDDVFLHLCKMPLSQRTTPRKFTTSSRSPEVKMEREGDRNVEILSFKNIRDESVNIRSELQTCKLDQKLIPSTFTATKNYCSQVKALTVRTSIIYLRFISLPLIQLVLILINMLIALYAFGFDPKGLTLGAIIDNGQIHCDTNLGHPISSGRNVTRPEIDYTCRLLNIIEKLGVNWLGFYFADIPLAIFQGGLILTMIWWDRGEQIKGSWALIGLIFYLARVAVLSLYFVLGSLNVNVKDTTILTISVVMVYVYASDTIWPIEAVVWWYRPFCHCLPLTVTIRVLRSVMTKGWGITHPTVFFGLICFPLIITGISTMVSFVVERRNKK
ncbi:ABC transporter G family member 20 [Folsomia candida]|uniref:ABC transporter G family member 20 n=1 Tax=Folsomia candida TaxID=158441 RepID=A0A226CXV2_FOLCA|nr:ABC transporter G family member 20 [Folsomia candida]